MTSEYLNPHEPPASCIREERLSEEIEVSVVIPSSDGVRGGNVERLMNDLRMQSLRSIQVIMVIGVSPQGKAINRGVLASSGAYLLILDDDSRVPDPETIERMMLVLKENPQIGMLGASIVQPPEATPFQRRIAREFPRFNMPVVSELTDSDMPCHGCCIMRRCVFDEIGGEPENIVRGLDPVLRQRLREHGYRVVLMPHLAVSHPVPGSYNALIRMFFRNGRGSAYAHRHSPEAVFDTQEETAWDGRLLQRPLWRRMADYPVRTMKRLLTGDFVRGLGDFVYAAGYLCEMVAPINGHKSARRSAP